MTRRRLYDFAHARAGDKGDTSSVAVFVDDPADYPALKAGLTPERVKSAFPDLIRGEVVRYELDGLHGVNLVMRSALEGGVNSSLNLDSHGKSWSFLILGLDVEA
ncbi:hypothetical protein [Enterovirga sp.]|uniref:AtuA-related protein n=1 Tax=Enterovirga sp. TaxID=2026350 RepID=UPI0026186AC8|nr:hypothetical protein [Enterovirga sp.]MDB5590441.1 hypothetical protein [Enterovirga sp.]